MLAIIHTVHQGQPRGLLIPPASSSSSSPFSQKKKTALSSPHHYTYARAHMRFPARRYHIPTRAHRRPPLSAQHNTAHASCAHRTTASVVFGQPRYTPRRRVSLHPKYLYIYILHPHTPHTTYHRLDRNIARCTVCSSAWGLAASPSGPPQRQHIRNAT